jgi:hypothetical protein
MFLYGMSHNVIHEYMLMVTSPYGGTDMGRLAQKTFIKKNESL